MNVHIVQHNIFTNNPEENMKWIQAELDTQESRDALLTVFPACTLCQPTKRVFEVEEFLHLCQFIVTAIKELSQLKEIML